MSKKKRNVDIDVLKGIGIISVVLGHAMNTDNFSAPIIEMIRRFVYTYHLAIFFFCTGYLLKITTYKDIIKRFLKQYKMFILICLNSFLFLPLWIKENMIVNCNIKSICVIVKNVLFFRQDGFYVGAMWFVPFMAVTVLMYSVIYLLFYNNYRNGFYVIVIILGVIGLLMVPYKGIGGYYKWIAMLMIPIMTLGKVYKKYENQLDAINVYIIVPVVSLILVILYCGNNQIELSKGLIYSRVGFYPLSCLGILLCIVIKNLIIKFNVLEKIISKIGNYSMFIMGYHFIIFKCIDVVISKINNVSIEQLNLFPFSFPQMRIIYFVGGIFIPVIAREAVKKISIVIRKSSNNDKNQTQNNQDDFNQELMKIIQEEVEYFYKNCREYDEKRLIDITIAEDVYEKCQQYKMCPSQRKEVFRMGEKLNTLNGTVIFAPSIKNPTLVVISKRALCNKDIDELRGTIVHELTHAHDFYDFVNQFKIENHEEMFAHPCYKPFYYWTEFHARQLGYKRFVEYKFGKEIMENQTILLKNIKLNLRKNSFKGKKYDIMQAMGRYYDFCRWNIGRKENFKEDILRNSSIKDEEWENLQELYQFLCKNTEFKMFINNVIRFNQLLDKIEENTADLNQFNLIRNRFD